MTAAKWSTAIQTSSKEAFNMLVVATRQVPTLSRAGLDNPTITAYRFEGPPLVRVPYETDYTFTEESLQEIAAAADWIKLQKVRTTYNSAASSYAYKHMVERWFSVMHRHHMYIGNGSFIAAAVGMGLAFRPVSKRNVEFKFSQKTVDLCDVVDRGIDKGIDLVRVKRQRDMTRADLRFLLARP